MITCAITTSILGCLVTVLLYFRYIFPLETTFSIKAVLFAVSLLVGCFPLLVSYKFENFLGGAYPFYRYALYYIFISCIILLTITLLRDAVWMAGCKTGLISMHSKAYCLQINLITIALSLIFGGWALYEGIKVPALKQLTLSSEKLKENHKIAVLSDLHIHRSINPQKIKAIVEETNRQNPDVILLAGDIIDDDVKRVADITALLKELKAKKGIYFVTGNHEFYAGYKETVIELQQAGFTLLENNGIEISPDFYVAGVPDLFSGRSYGKIIDLEKTFAGSKDGQFRLLVSHTPADFKAENNFDLEISGHTHGGQIFPFHLFALLHNRYLAGLYEMGNGARIYVSRGSGQWGPQMRFLAPSEITILNLAPKN